MGNVLSGGEASRFNAKELDEETGLYYYGARYLNPRTSRWISSDPAGFDLINPNRQGYSIIEAVNWYSYTSSNPVKYTDPTGMGEETPVKINSSGNLILQTDRRLTPSGKSR